MPDDNKVHLELTPAEFAGLVMVLGYAHGVALLSAPVEFCEQLMRVANAVNRNNPNWTPFETEREGQ